MLYTATIVMCLLGEPHSYKTCDLMNGSYKFRTEAECQQSTINRVKNLMEYTDVFDRYEIIDNKCLEWIAIGPQDQKL